MFNTETETLQEIDLQEVMTDTFDLIIYNDDVNTFEHVTASLVDVCDHDAIQAEQCTWIIHHSGKCSVKRGSFEKLEPMCTALLERNLRAKIEG